MEQHSRHGFIQRGFGGGGCTKCVGESNPKPHFGGNVARRAEHAGDTGHDHDYYRVAIYSGDSSRTRNDSRNGIQLDEFGCRCTRVGSGGA
jgi:hypothetical protein